MSENTVTLVGTLTRDIEIRYTSGGRAVGDVGLARNTRRKNPQTQEWEDGDPQFFDLTIWGEAAENAASSVGRGSRVIATGELRYEAWENEAGEKRSKVKVNVDAIGPDLRWATASVTKIQKGDGGSRPAAQQRPAPAAYAEDEEPF